MLTCIFKWGSCENYHIWKFVGEKFFLVWMRMREKALSSLFFMLIEYWHMDNTQAREIFPEIGNEDDVGSTLHDEDRENSPCPLDLPTNMWLI